LFTAAAHPDPGRHSQIPASGALHASVVFDPAGTAYVADMAGGIRAIAPDGRARWERRLTGGVSATPALDCTTGRLFVATVAGAVYCLDAGSGDVVWQRAIPTASDPRILSDLLFAGDRVVLSSWGGRFHALDGTTGKSQFDWNAGISPRSAVSCDSSGTIYSARAVHERGVELVATDSSGAEKVLFVEPEDDRGARRTLVAAAPVLEERRSRIYFVANRGRGARLHAWSIREGSLLWTRELEASVQATPALTAEGHVIVCDLSGCVSRFTPGGEAVCRHDLRCDYLLAGAVCPGTEDIIVADPLGYVHRIDPTGRAARWLDARRSFQARPSFSPSGALYAACTDGAVHVVAAEA